MKVSTVFDTHRFIMSLIQAGMAEEQATILSDTYTELLNDRLATKDDIARLEQTTKDDIAGVKEDIARLEDDMTGVREDIARLEQTTKDMKGDIARHEENTEKKLDLIQEKMKQTELRMTIVLGGIMAIGIGIMAILNNL